MQPEVDELTSGRDVSEAEVRAIEAHGSGLLQELGEDRQVIEFSRKHQNMDASNCMQEDASKEDVMAAQTKFHAAEGKLVTMGRTMEALNKTKAEKDEMYGSLQVRLEKRKENRNGAQDNSNALTAAVQEFCVLEETWRKHKQNIIPETADNRARNPHRLSNWEGMLLGRFELNTGRRTCGCLERNGSNKNPAGLAAEAKEYAPGP